jgi:hypothetical protein
MVRAIIEGRKTQTRRVVNPQPPSWANDPQSPVGTFHTLHGNHPKGKCGFSQCACINEEEGGPSMWTVKCPYGQPGDRLWVRETFYAFGRWDWRFDEKKGRDAWHFVDLTDTTLWGYRFDRPSSEGVIGKKRDVSLLPYWWKRPAIFMPRAASRIMLEVVSVRVERLQEISEEDAKAEGALYALDGEQTMLSPHLTDERNQGCVACRGDARGIAALCHLLMRGKGRPHACWFASLWDSIHPEMIPILDEDGKKVGMQLNPSRWDANPSVWVVEFKRVEA